MWGKLPVDLIVEIGLLTGPDEYEELAKTSKRNAIILQKPYIIKVTNEILVKVTFPSQVEFHYQNKKHSFNDQPAIIWVDGSKYWYQYGKIHRDNDQPAMIYANGQKVWYQHNEIHRDNDQPAIIYSDGSKSWYQHGKLHRDNGKPKIIYVSCHTEWYQPSWK
jgi:hypothetical protein